MARKRTDNPIHAFKQRSPILLLPQLDPWVDLNPPRELPQSTLEALHLWRPHIGKASGSMPVQRRQGDVVEIYQPDLRNPTEQMKKATLMVLAHRRRESGTYDLASMTAAQLPTPPHPITATLAPRIFFIPSSPKNA